MTKSKKQDKTLNIYNVLYPIYFISKIFGLAPYTYNSEKSKWKITNSGLIQTLVPMMIIIIFIYPAIKYQYNNLQGEHTDYLSIYSDIFRTGQGIVTSSCILIISLIKRKEICDLIVSFENIDDDFKRLGIYLNNNAILKNIKSTTIIVYMFLLIVLAIDFGLFTHQGAFLTYIYWTGVALSFLTNVTATCQFNTQVYLIYKRFAILNEYITNLSTSDVISTSSWVFKKNKRIFNIQTAGKSFDNLKFINVLPSNNDSVNILCEIHDKLCNLTKKLNALYSIHILLITSTTFVVLVTQLYFFYLMLSSNKNYNLTYQNVWTAAIWGILFFITLYTISFACSKTKDEANLSSILLHKIDTNENDEFTRMSIEMFSLQMLHQKVEFTACGFFEIDFSVLYMIIGAVTTYLVFLIQFEMAGRSPSVESTVKATQKPQ